MKPIFKTTALILIIFFGCQVHSFAQTNYYWVGGTGNWSDSTNHWATSSGGTDFHSQLPSEMDTVYFDTNSFNGSDQIVTIDTLAICYDFYWNQGDHMPTLVFEEDNDEADIEIHGSSTWGNVKVEIPYLSLDSHGEEEFFDPNGTSFEQTEVYVYAQRGSLELLDSLTVLEMGFVNMFENFSTNGHPIHALESFELRLSFFGTIDLSSSDIYTKSFRATSAMGANAVFNTSDASVTILYPGGTTQIDKTRHPNPLVENYTIYADHTIQNEAAIFDNLIVKPGVELSIHYYPEAIEVNKLIARGDVERITIKTLVEGNTASILQNSGEVDVYMVDFIDVNATGSATFDAYASTGEINFDGWNFIVGDQTIEMEFEDKDFEDINRAFNITPGASSGLTLDLISSNESVAIISGPNEYTIVGMGTTQITANQSGDDLFNAAPEIIRILEVTKANQSITFNEIDDVSFDEDFLNLAASSTSGLDITYHIVGPATLDNNTVVFTAPGTVQVTATQVGNDNYFEAEEAYQTFEVLKLDQTINFATLPEETNALDETISLAASSTSDLEVTFSISGPATLDGNDVVFTGAGTVEIVAEQSGDEIYNPAGSITQSIEVNKMDQSILFGALSSEYFLLDQSIPLSAESSSGLDISYSVSGPVELDGSSLTITGAGLVEISAIQEGNQYYHEAPSVIHSFDVLKADQTISFESISPEISILEGSLQLMTSSTSGLPVHIEILGPASLEGSVLSLDAAGIVEIIVSQTGSDNYNAAATLSQSFEIVKASQTITFSEIEDIRIEEETLTLDAMSSSELPIEYTVLGPVSLEGNILTFTGVGEVEITASQAGNNSYLAAENVTRRFEILPTEVTLSISQETAKIFIHPNPTFDFVYIESEHQIQNLEIFNQSGKRIHNPIIIDDYNRLNFNNLENGIYIINIRFDTGQFMTQRIVKQ